LQREAAPAQLADDGYGDEFIPAVNAAMALAAGRDDASFVPPLQLAGGDSGEDDYVVGCELSLHLEPILFQTKRPVNVWNILGGADRKRVTFRYRSY
jgi:hypothetical protein